MNMLEDTICAVATAAGVGGIAVVRISGPEAIIIADKCFRSKPLAETPGYTARVGWLVDSEGHELDQCVATVYRAPRSFTGEDVVELAVHGSRWIQHEVLNVLIDCGCRIAEPGEFTRRAFTSGKMDLAQAEGVADVIAASSHAAHRVALNQMRGDYSRHFNDMRERLVELASLLELEIDFSEEEVEFASRDRLRSLAEALRERLERLHRSFRAGSAIRQGIPVAIVGATNAGKSSLLNAILGDDRAIVSDIPGTTRDLVEDTLEIGGFLFRFIDTAGLRHTADPIENLGIDRSRRAAASSSIVILTLDASDSATDVAALLAGEPMLLSGESRVIVALNKSDLPAAITPEAVAAVLPDALIVATSATSGTGIDALTEALAHTARAISDEATEDSILVTSARHAQTLADASDSITRVIDGLAAGLTPDLIAIDLRQTIHHLSLITGQITTTDLLTSIFSHFCIGK